MGLSYSIAFQISGQIDLPILNVWQQGWNTNSMVSQERSRTHGEGSGNLGLSSHWFADRHYIHRLDLFVHPEDSPNFFIAERADFHCG
jgi:hypothetical protein